MARKAFARLTSRIPQIVKEATVEQQLVMERSAKRISAGARDRVPVDSGDLKKTIRAQRQDNGTWAVNAGNNKAFYAHFVEFGSVREAARPYLTPAAEVDRQRFMREMAGIYR